MDSKRPIDRRDRSLFTAVLLLMTAAFVVGLGVVHKQQLGLALAGALLPLGSLAHRRHERPVRTTLREDSPQLSMPLVALPMSVALATQSPIASGVLLVGLSAYALSRHAAKTVHVRYRGRVAVLAMLASSLIVWSRPHNASATLFAILCVFSITIVTTCVPSFRNALYSLHSGVGFYLVVSTASYALGLRSPSAGIRVQGLSGALLFAERVLFPFAKSYAEAPAVAAAYLASVAPMLLGIRQGRGFRIIAALAALIVLAAADGRVALFVGVVAFVMTLVVPVLFTRMAMPVVCLALALPFIFPIATTGTTKIFKVIQSAMGSSVRSNERVGSLNNRDIIWSNSLSHFRCCVSPTRQLFGYGVNGQYRSGAAETYIQIFSGFSSRTDTFTSVHSSSLQMLFDSGIAGMSMWILGIIGILTVLLKRDNQSDPLAFCALAFGTVLVITAATEVTLAPGVLQLPFWLFVMLSGVSTLPSTSNVLTKHFTAHGSISGQISSAIATPA